MRLFHKRNDERPQPSTPGVDDPAAEEAKRAYQSDKLAAYQAHVERLARVKRLGYELDLTIRKDSR